MATDNTALTQALEARGLVAVAQTAHWEPFEVKGRAGWAYPVYNALGHPYRERRWKSLDGGGPKYLWLWEKPEKAKYYFLPGAFSEIENHWGACYLAGGEPDVLAYNAAGLKNAICWLDGEGSPPKTLANDLAHMGVTVLYYAPDRDYAGMVSAHKVQQLLEGSDIDLFLFALPGDLGSKYDVNDLWMECGQEAEAFKSRLLACSELDAVDAALYAQQPPQQKHNADRAVSDQLNDWRREWEASIMRALGPAATKERDIERWHCPLPSHADKNPSFTFTDRQKPGHLWPVCTCDIQNHADPWGELADALGVEDWRSFKALKLAEMGYSPALPSQRSLSLAPSGTDQVPKPEVQPKWVDLHDEYAKLKSELSGEVKPHVSPVVFPLTVLHRYGGFARFMRRGKLIAVTGVSGGGKTLLIKTMMLILMRAGYDVIWWGPEWSPEEYAEQDLQRIDGMTMDQLDEWRLWQHYDDQGIAKEMSSRYGLTKPPEAAVRRANEKVDDLLSIPGHMYLIPDMDMPLKDVCTLAQGIASLKRNEGRDVAAFAFDYVQLAQLSGARDWTWAERVVMEVKTLCSPRVANLCGFVSSQARKKDSEKVREGDSLTHGSAQGLSDAQFNLYLTLTPEYDGEERLNTSWLHVQKNSRGRFGKVRVYADYEHLAVLDKEVKTVRTPLNDPDAAPAPLDLGGAP